MITIIRSKRKNAVIVRSLVQLLQYQIITNYHCTPTDNAVSKNVVNSKQPSSSSFMFTNKQTNDCRAAINIHAILLPLQYNSSIMIFSSTGNEYYMSGTKKHSDKLSSSAVNGKRASSCVQTVLNTSNCSK